MKRPRLSFSPDGGSPLILSSTAFDNRNGVTGMRITVSGLESLYCALPTRMTVRFAEVKTPFFPATTKLYSFLSFARAPRGCR